MSELSSIWTKSNCLSKTQLQQYLRHTLDREEEYLVETHLNDCDFCSDALEGMMHVDQEQAAQQLEELKTDFGKKLEALQKEEKKGKIIPLATEQATPTTSKLEHRVNPNRFRWVYAASILLVVGLGYSVFSFIRQYQVKKDVSQQMDTKVSSAEKPYIAVQDSSMERIHLEVRPEDINGNRSPELEKAVSEAKKTIHAEPGIQDKTADENKDKVDMLAPVSPAREAASAPEPVVKSEAESADDYREDTKKIESTAKNLSSGKPGGGLKKSSTPQVQAPATNQMNYSSNANQNAGNQDESQLESVTVSEKKKESSGTDYEEAVTLYNKGNYRKAIRKLERLLPDSKGNRREDILYFLAMSYRKSGNESQAERYYAQLNQSSRYGKQAADAIREMKK